jgi:hypothetical protein
MKLLIPTILTAYRPKADGSWSVSFSTPILNREQKQIIDSLHNQACFLLIKEAEISADEVELIDSVDVDLGNTKTPSKRLKDVLFVCWTQDNKGYTDFKDFYKHKMEVLIEHFKSKLL